VRKSVGLRVVRVESAETSSLIPSTLVKCGEGEHERAAP